MIQTFKVEMEFWDGNPIAAERVESALKDKFRYWRMIKVSGAGQEITCLKVPKAAKYEASSVRRLRNKQGGKKAKVSAKAGRSGDRTRSKKKVLGMGTRK